MKFDTIIIGGGLSALTAGIKLAKTQKRVAMIEAGQSTLHFSSGSFGLLGYDSKGDEVKNPLEAIASLPAEHPYHKIKDLKATLAEAHDVLKESDIIADGDDSFNHYRISPIGELAPAWLTLNGMLTTDGKRLPWKEVNLVNVTGFLDFHTAFLREALEKLGAHVTISNITTPELENARRSPSEFRATTIGNYLNNETAAKHFAEALNNLPTSDCLLLPAILGLSGDIADTIVRKEVNKPIYTIATMHPSRVGQRIAEQMRRHFTNLGGEIFLSDTVERGEISNGKVTRIYTHNMADEALEADNYILATGSFMSRGLASNYQEVWEPIFKLDVEASKNRLDWHDPDFFNNQEFLSFGVKTDGHLHALKEGDIVDNLYAAGSILSGNNFISYDDHEGFDMLSAIQVVKNIFEL